MPYTAQSQGLFLEIQWQEILKRRVVLRVRVLGPGSRAHVTLQVKGLWHASFVSSKSHLSQ